MVTWNPQFGFLFDGKLEDMKLKNIFSKLFKTFYYLTWNLNSGTLFWWKKYPTLPMYGGFSIGRKYWPNKVLVSVLDLNQNSGFGCTQRWALQTTIAMPKREISNLFLHSCLNLTDHTRNRWWIGSVFLWVCVSHAT